MYENYYRLSADPFRLGPDHRFVLGHRSYAKARAYLEYALSRGEGFIVITGEPGTGKTTLINEIMASLQKTRLQVATVNSTQLEAKELLQMVAASFGVRTKGSGKAALLLALEQFLVEQNRMGKRAVLIVDEAQGLSASAVEELRLLANLQVNNRLLLQVFLVGQEQLRDQIRSPEMDHLRQRIIAASHIEPLTLEETVDYVEHRLKCVGYQGDPAISEDALRIIHRFSGGIPRRVNLICSRLFLFGSMEQKHELSGEDARGVVEDLQLELLLSEAELAAFNGDVQTDDVDSEHAPVLALPREDRSDVAPVSAGPSRQPEEAVAVPVAAEAVEEARTSAVKAETASDESDSWAEAMADPSTRTVEQPVDATPGHGVEKSLHDQLVESEIGPRKTRRWGWGWLSIIALLTGFMLAATIEPDIRDQMLGLMRVIPSTDLPPQEPGGMAQETPQEKARVASEGRVLRSRTASPSEQVAPDRQADNEPSTVTDQAGVAPGAAGGDATPASTAVSVSSAPEADETSASGESMDTAQVNTADSTESVSVANTAGEVTATPAAGDDQSQEASAELAPMEPARAMESVKPLPLPSEEKPPAAPVEALAQDSGVDEPVATPPVLTASAAPVAERQAPRAQADAAGTVPPAALEEQRLRLRREAELRFSQRLARAEAARELSTTVRQTKAAARVKKKSPGSDTAEESVTAHRTPARVAVKAPAAVVTSSVSGKAGPAGKPAPLRTAKAIVPASTVPDLRTSILHAKWDSRGKPAILLPSDTTYCKEESKRIRCWSVPQKTRTKYGPAIYKVEATLEGFSAGGEFRLSYRTLVRLTGDEAAGKGNDTGWQITEHDMRCRLLNGKVVRCRDGKGVIREYQRKGSAGKG